MSIYVTAIFGVSLQPATCPVFSLLQSAPTHCQLQLRESPHPTLEVLPGDIFDRLIKHKHMSYGQNLVRGEGASLSRVGPYRFCSGGTLYKLSWWYPFGYRFRVGPYRFCSNGNPTTLSILLCLFIPNFVWYSYHHNQNKHKKWEESNDISMKSKSLPIIVIHVHCGYGRLCQISQKSIADGAQYKCIQCVYNQTMNNAHSRTSSFITTSFLSTYICKSKQNGYIVRRKWSPQEMNVVIIPSSI